MPMPSVVMSLQDFLLSILSGTLVLGPALWFFLNQTKILESLPPNTRTLAVAGLSGVIGVGAWGLSILLGYIDAPQTSTAIVEGIWTYGIGTGLTTFGSSTVLNNVARSAKVS